jgi:hypothetical protein
MISPRPKKKYEVRSAANSATAGPAARVILTDGQTSENAIHQSNSIISRRSTGVAKWMDQGEEEREMSTAEDDGSDTDGTKFGGFFMDRKIVAAGWIVAGGVGATAFSLRHTLPVSFWFLLVLGAMMATILKLQQNQISGMKCTRQSC